MRQGCPTWDKTLAQSLHRTHGSDIILWTSGMAGPAAYTAVPRDLPLAISSAIETEAVLCSWLRSLQMIWCRLGGWSHPELFPTWGVPVQKPPGIQIQAYVVKVMTLLSSVLE